MMCEVVSFFSLWLAHYTSVQYMWSLSVHLFSHLILFVLPYEPYPDTARNQIFYLYIKCIYLKMKIDVCVCVRGGEVNLQFNMRIHALSIFRILPIQIWF